MESVIIDCSTKEEARVELTPQEVADRDAQAAVAAVATQAEATRQGNDLTLRQRLATADAACKTYEAINNPTAAQTTAHVKLMSRLMRGLIRLELRNLDAVD